uniref:Polyprotein n=1 Tax=Pitahaya virus E TaxID=3144105 RepID=A0AAU6WJP8_9VIRU
MALTYRSPIEEVLTLLEPTSQSLVASTATTHLQQSEKEFYAWFCYSMPASAKEHLSKAGIYLSPYSGYPHSHPVCKTLENYLLYSVVSNIVNNTFFFVGIKHSKLNFLKSRRKNMSTVAAINRYVTSADKVRYGNEFVYKPSSEVPGLHRHRELLTSDALKNLVPNVKKGCNLFFHDELHYWSKDDLITFLEVVEPEVLLATVIFPPEIFVGAKTSLNPWCYDFEVKGGRLSFFPDGVRSEGYEQPLNGGYLLKANYIELPNGVTYSVDLVCSKFAHHLVSVTRGKLVTPKRRSFGPFEAVGSEGLTTIDRKRSAFYPVSFQIVSRLYRYLRSLKKPDKQSAMAKFSQLVPEPSGAAIKFIEEFSNLVIGTGTIQTSLDAERIKIFFGELGSRLPSGLASLLKRTKTVCLDAFISMLKPLTVSLDLVTITRNSTLFDWSDVFIESELDITEVEQLFTDSWEGGKLERIRSPYHSMLPLHDRKQHLVIASYRQALAERLCALYLISYCSPGYKCGHDLEEYLLKVRHCTNLLIASVIASFDPELVKAMRNHVRAMNPQGIWFSEGIKWFLLAKSRMVVHFIECSDSANWRSQAEFNTSSTRWGPKFKVQFSTYNGFSDDFPEMTSEPVHQAAPTSVHETTSEPTGFKEQPNLRQALNCSCGLGLDIREFPYAQENGAQFPDALRGRQAGWYSRSGEGYSYTGGTHASLGWPKWIDLWLELHGVPLEKYNCLLAQKYERGAEVRWHADDEPCFDPNGTILTVNVLGSAIFKIKCQAEKVGMVTLHSGQGFTMPSGFQLTHKHMVRSLTHGRVSFTFRVLLDKRQPPPASVKSPTESKDTASDYSSEEEELVKQEGDVKVSYSTRDVMPIVQCVPNSGGGDCFWLAMEYFTGIKAEYMKLGLKHYLGASEEFNVRLASQLQPQAWAEDESIIALCDHLCIDICIIDHTNHSLTSFRKIGNEVSALLMLKGNHYEAAELKEACALRAIASALGRQFTDVQKVVLKRLGRKYTHELLGGQGVSAECFKELLHLFDIHGILYIGDEVLEINPEGTAHSAFKLEDDHVSHLHNNSIAKFPSTNVRKETLVASADDLVGLLEMCSVVSYSPDLKRAECLAESLLNGSTGVICSSLFHGEGTLLPSDPTTASRSLNFILGTFGCGKSTLFKNFLSSVPGKSLIYVSPRKALCEDFKRLIEKCGSRFGAAGVKHFKAWTFESALKRSDKFIEGCVVILDEIQLFPPGYVDLLMCRLVLGARIFILGDPCQSDYDSEKDRSILGAITSDVHHILGGAKYKYNVLSRRFKNHDFVGRLPCVIPPGSEINEQFKLVEGLDCAGVIPEYLNVCLVSSFEEKKIVGNFFGQQCKCFTFGESTGLTFQKGSVLVSYVSVHTSENRWITALSRFREGIALINCSSSSWPVLTKQYSNRVLGRFIEKKADPKDLLSLLPGEPILTEGFKCFQLGADEGKREEKLQGDPWLKAMINLFQIEDQETIEMAEAVMEDPWFKTHLPVCEMEGVRARWVHKILAKEAREKRMGHLVSEQFTDEHSKQPGKQLTNAAERFETIYPRHRASDTVTFIMAVRKRLRFSDPIKESSKLQNAMPYGPFLLKEFLKKVPLKPMHNRNFMEEALHEFEEKKTSKSAATIENHSNRSCRDWLADVGMVFSKSQLCTKYDNRFRDAKAAQTIVCFQHSVLCRFAPYMRYIEKKLVEALPARFYIHSGKGLEELNDWVMRNNFNGICTESDYEAFDASQDQYIVAFELCLMRYLGIPRDLIEDYKYIKTHLGSKLGSFAIMRFSGEASTFLFNTMANMLFTFLRYSLNGHESICFAGDDMCANTSLKVSQEHAGFLKKLKLKAKVDRTARPTFCGWCLSPHGIYKRPQLVYERMCIAKETCNLHNCIDNYAIEVSYAYKLGEVLKEYMNEEELDAMYNCVRVIVKNKHLLKSTVVEIFSSGVYD